MLQKAAAARSLCPRPLRFGSAASCGLPDTSTPASVVGAPGDPGDRLLSRPLRGSAWGLPERLRAWPNESLSSQGFLGPLAPPPPGKRGRGAQLIRLSPFTVLRCNSCSAFGKLQTQQKALRPVLAGKPECDLPAAASQSSLARVSHCCEIPPSWDDEQGVWGWKPGVVLHGR